MSAIRSSNVLVLGLGNTLLGDDGVGVHVVRRLRSDAATPPWVRLVDGGTMGFRLTRLMGSAGEVLIIDAANLSEAPGTIRLLDAQTLAAHVGRDKKSSAHEAGLADLLTLARLENFAPRHLAVLAIQPLTIDWRETLSEPVEKAVNPACEMIRTTILDWCRAA
jgi:hydrogenase maturation protease